VIVRGGGRGRIRLVVGCAALLPALAACGIQPSGITTLGAAPAAAPATAPNGLSPAIGSDQYVLFFYQGNKLVPIYRPATSTVNEAYVLKQLLNGPNATEKAQGYTSALPAKLTAQPNAQQERYAFGLSAPLTSRARSEFICTMQYIDGTDSIGIEQLDQPSSMIWVGCSDTTIQYVPVPLQGGASPSPSGE
jgi:hypothetical protein